MQAVAWIYGREKPNGLVSTVPGAKGWLNKVAKALEQGVPLLLEDQLLSTVVGHERPDLLKEAKELGDNRLYLLATAEGDILANEALIITLEETKIAVGEISAKQVIAAKTFELYRPDAARGSFIYTLMNKLNVIGPVMARRLQLHLLQGARKGTAARGPRRRHGARGLPSRVGDVHALQVRLVRPLQAPPSHLLDAARGSTFAVPRASSG